MTELRVDLYGERVGTIVERRDTWDFVVDSGALDRYGVGSNILSLAIPLASRPRASDAPLRRNFFDEILPEGRARARLAGNARIAPDYTVGMLARYGRDVAGALTIWDESAPGEPRTPSTNRVSDARIRELLAEVRTNPIGNTTARRMSSLAGVQDKIVLTLTEDGWAEPLDGFPSSHILKPVVGERPSLIFDEEYGSRIARHLGLAAFDSRIVSFDGVSALVVERYDRGAATPDGRVHQEDFNQALGVTGDGKYQADGHPGLAAIAKLLRTVDRPGVERLLQMVALSTAIGNLDMHAKNISVLHEPDGRSSLAPMYDVVPQLHFDFDEKVALFVNGKEDYRSITLADLAIEGRRWGLRSAEEVVETTIERIRDFVRTETPHPGAAIDLSRSIENLCTDLLDNSVRARVRSGPRTVTGGWGGPTPRPR